MYPYQGETVTEWFSVNSSNIEAIGRTDKGNLAARFKGGRVYIYETGTDTEPRIEQLLHENALVLQNPTDERYSVGRLFNRVIKGSGYDYRQIGG